MVASDSSFEDKSPSPKPFKEPENMFTIDLNKNDYCTNGTTENNFKTKENRMYKTLILAGGIFFFCAFLISTFLLLLHGHIQDVIKANDTSSLDSLSIPMPITFNILLRNKDNFIECNKTLSFQDCCYLFFENQFERCTWDNVLSFFVKYELEALQRYKRQTYEDYYQPNYDYENVNFDYSLQPEPNEYKMYENEYFSDDNFNYNNNINEQDGEIIESEVPNENFSFDDNYLLGEKHAQTNRNDKVENLCPDENCPEVVQASTEVLEISKITSTPKTLQIDVNNTNIKISSDFQSNKRANEDRAVNNHKTVFGMPSFMQNRQYPPCVYSFNSPFLSTSPSSYSNYFMQQPPFYLPPVYPYMPPLSSPYIPSQSSNMYNKPLITRGGVFQVSSGNGGPFYVCNPVSDGVSSTNTVGSTEDDQIREAYNLQDLLEIHPKPAKNNRTREAIDCPMGARSCIDGSKCIHQRQICDNEVNCKDASDEIDCSCKARVGEIRACDGYLDCPNGEDEQNCFNCEEDEFSCDDWSRFQPGTCVPMSQRCDGIKQCDITGRDEEDCSILTNHVGHQPMYKISNAAGFLHRNFKGKWYPTCFGADYFATEVCKTEAGPSNIPPISHLITTNDNYPGPFLDVSHTGQLILSEMCIEHKAAFVECPPLFCGIRFIINNPFRASEVDTSAEELLNHLQRYSLIRNAKTSSAPRVVGGRPSQPTSWPWVVSIYKNGIFHCGGVLINDMWVLTAAHCVDRFWFYYYEIQAGMLRRFSYSPMEQIRFATVAIPHEDYSKKSLKNDIALIKLSKPVRLNRYVRPICLPSETTAGDNFLKGPTPNTVCITVGWGATIEHGADPDHLREVEIPILPHCKHTEDREGDEICAGLLEGGRDACQGDSGGPLMCRNVKNHNQWYLAGIVSHGEGCARPNEPGVYTKVSKYLGWISENLNGKFSGRTPLAKCPGYVCQGTNKCISKKRHCDKIVDCYYGDDELNCWQHQTHSLFRSGLVGSSHGWLNDFINLIDVFDITDHVLNDTSSENEHIEKIPKQLSPSKNVSEPTSFTCNKLLQVIPLQEKCNKVINCEDGSDESSCNCVDYLKNTAESAICDGITDCKDLSDEAFCESCSSSEFLCRVDQKCIPLKHRCDGKPNCDSGEDEWDCVALTDGKTLTFDSDLRPTQHMKGIITINRFGVWRPLCTNAENTASIAANVCNLLGFEEYTAFHKLSVQDKPLNVTVEGVERQDSVEEAFNCDGMYIICVNTSFSSIHHLEINRGELYTLPWSAAIYSDGLFCCIGTILNAYWIIAPGSCLPENPYSYIAAVLGKGKAHIDIEGPHEQIIPISKISSIKRNDAIILRSEQRIFFSRYIKPTPLTTRASPYAKEQCIAVTFTNQKSQLVFLKVSNISSMGLLLFNSTNKCQEMEYPNSGLITCNARNGWYPAAIFNHVTNTCNFSKIEYPLLNKTEIELAMGNNLLKINAKFCDGFRCLLGQCIASKHVCDGVPHCRGGEDEDFELCATKKSLCHLHNNCTNFSGCELSEFKCKSGMCIPKNAFCDGNDDCGDLFDEPAVCSCKTYMETVHPEKMCDGTVNCWDHSDEDPKVCGCQNSHNITCGDSSSFCVSTEMLCDGFSDCPNNEDEKHCYMLRTSIDRKNSGKVLVRTAGVWHSGCFSKNLTTSFLEKTCQRLGFTGTGASRLETPSGKNSSSLHPVLDHFDLVSLRRGLRKIKLSMRLRTGNEPHVKFIEDSKCHKLYIECW